MDGILLLDKPVGWTSHDVVAMVRKTLRTALSDKQLAVSQKQSANSQQLTAPSAKLKVGHTGTLDPMASGLLVLVLGSYTKRASEFSKLDKTYEAELTLGAVSTTGDSEGEIRPKSGREPTLADITRALSELTGQIQQTPHIYSAVKVGGQRSYKLARQGKAVKLEPRKVKVHSLAVTGYRYPKLQILTEVSSGTYIRSLAEDIGQKVGSGAYLTALRRTKIGNFDVNDSLFTEKINQKDIEKAIALTIV
ncbi:MAG: tRNA pseudouridine(55) synthase TruB [Candidatus Saccharimonadales bacterium]